MHVIVSCLYNTDLSSMHLCIDWCSQTPKQSNIVHCIDCIIYIYIYCSFQHGSARVPYQSSFFSVGDSEICALIIYYYMYIFNLLPGRTAGMTWDEASFVGEV